MMQFLNWNFELFFFLLFRVDWVNYYICREAGGRVIDDWAKVSCPSIGSWPAKQAGTGGKYFSIFSRFFFYLKIWFVEKRTIWLACLLLWGSFHDSGCFGWEETCQLRLIRLSVSRLDLWRVVSHRVNWMIQPQQQQQQPTKKWTKEKPFSFLPSAGKCLGKMNRMDTY